MKALTIANPKGGSGKSTLATNLAGYLANIGYPVMLGDVDRQLSSRHWLNSRSEDLPRIRSWDIGRDNIARPPQGTTHAVLDTPAGLHGKRLEKVMRVSSHLLIPVQPSIFDIRAVDEFIQEVLSLKSVEQGKTKIALVGMRVNPRTRSAQDLQDYFLRLNVPVLTCLRDTQLYAQTAFGGLTLFDLPSHKISKDLTQWAPIIDWIDIAPKTRGD